MTANYNGTKRISVDPWITVRHHMTGWLDFCEKEMKEHHIKTEYDNPKIIYELSKPKLQD